MVQDIAFSLEGDVYALVYRLSHNIYIYNAVSDEVLHILAAGTGPVDIEFTTNHMYVCSLDSKDLSIFNASGQCVLTKEHDKGTCKIPVSTLPEGVYVVHNKTERGLAGGKMVVRRLFSSLSY
jgi:hypothetical protein